MRRAQAMATAKVMAYRHTEGAGMREVAVYRVPPAKCTARHRPASLSSVVSEQVRMKPNEHPKSWEREYQKFLAKSAANAARAEQQEVRREAKKQQRRPLVKKIRPLAIDSTGHFWVW